jgi:hypothetical protein
MRLWNYLRTFDAGEWIALTVILICFSFVVWGGLGTAWSGVSASVAVPSPDEVGRLDLMAQQNMVAAAWWMVGITMMSSAIGALGLYLIFRTLQEAKRSADAAHSAVAATMMIGKRQIRAYIDIENATAKIDRYQMVLTVDANFVNSGQSPARNIRGLAVLRFVEFHTPPEGGLDTHVVAEVEANFTASAVSAGKSGGLYLTFGMFGMRPPLHVILDDFGQRALQVNVSFQYTDVFDDISSTQSILGHFNPTFSKMREGVLLRVSSPEP